MLSKISRRLAIGFSFLGCAALLPAPASAALTSVTVDLVPPSGTSPARCPADFTLVATIKGTPGQNFDVSTQVTVDGAPAETTMTATIPAGGTYTDSVAVPIAVPANTVVVDVSTQTQPQLTKLSSAARTFAPTCSNASPAPAPSPVSTPSPISAPSNVRALTSSADCNSLKGLLPSACGSDVTAGKLQILWDESNPAIDEYDVYRVDGGRHDLVTTVKPGGVEPIPLPKYAAIDKPSAGYDNECLAVTATSGSNTSHDSARYCYTSGDTATVETLHPSYDQTIATWYIPQISNCSAPITPNSWVSSSIQFYGSGFTALYPFVNDLGSQFTGTVGVRGTTVGYEASVFGISYHESAFSMCATGQISPAGMSISSVAGIAFDLAHLRHHKIDSARLQLPSPQFASFVASADPTHVPGHFLVSEQTGWCSMEVGAASKEWWIAPIGNMQYDRNSKISENAYPLAGVDVAPFVSHWAANDDAGDYGFILDTPVGEADPIYSLACVNSFGTPTLNLTYF